MKIADRVKKRRMELGLSQQEIADFLRIRQPSIQRLEKGLVRNPKYLARLAEILKVTPEWLQFGIGQPVQSSENSVIPINAFVPLIGWNEVPNRPDGSIIKKKDRELIPMIGIGGEKCYALKIKGDSMISPMPGRPSFLENNIIIIDPERNPANGDFVIAKQRDAQEPIFKQYVIDGNDSYLRPLNPQYPLIHLNESITICGVVIAHMDVLI